MASCAEGLRRRRSTSLRINFLSAVSPSLALLSVRVRVRVRVKLRLRVKIRLRVSLRVYSVGLGLGLGFGLGLRFPSILTHTRPRYLCSLAQKRKSAREILFIHVVVFPCVTKSNIKPQW